MIPADLQPALPASMQVERRIRAFKACGHLPGTWVKAAESALKFLVANADLADWAACALADPTVATNLGLALTGQWDVHFAVAQAVTVYGTRGYRYPDCTFFEDCCPDRADYSSPFGTELAVGDGYAITEPIDGGSGSDRGLEDRNTAYVAVWNGSVLDKFVDAGGYSGVATTELVGAATLWLHELLHVVSGHEHSVDSDWIWSNDDCSDVETQVAHAFQCLCNKRYGTESHVD